MALLKQDVCELLPLFWGRVNTRRIVCTGVDQEHGAPWSFKEGIQESREVKADRLGIVIRIIYRIDTDVLEDSKVVH